MPDEEWRERRREHVRRWRANLSEEQKEHQRVTKRVWARANLDKRRENRKPLTEAQKVARRDYDSIRWANLTDEQRAEIAAKNKKRRGSRIEELKEYQRGRRESQTEEQKEYQRAYGRAWRESQTEEQEEYRRLRKSAYNKDKSVNLTDSYVKHLLRGSGFVNPPQELIELKRVQVKIRRYLNQGEQI